MILLAIHPADLFKSSWMQGCFVLLIGVWSFLALLGIRNARFPWRILGGLCFVLGSTLWLGLHPDLDFDTGLLGFAVRRGIVDHVGSALLLTSLSALLLVCSVIGLLIAVDWLPLLPLVPVLARFDERARRDPELSGAGEPERAARRGAPEPSLSMARGTAEALAASPRLAAPSLEPPELPSLTPPAVRSVALPKPAPIESEPAASDLAAEEGWSAEDGEGEEEEAATDEDKDEDDGSITNWARFRPRLRDDETPAEGPSSAPISAPASDETARESDEASDGPIERAAAPRTEGDLPVDIGSIASHNSTTPEGESRADGDGAAEAAAPVETNEEKEDAPVPDRDDEIPLTDARDDAPIAVVEPEEEDAALEVDELVETPSSAEPQGETLAPKRKKEEEDEPAEEPSEPADPDEDDEDEEGEDEEEGEEKEDDEDADEEDWDDEDAEEEEEDEDELDEEEEEEEEEEDEKEEEEDDAEEDEDDWDDDDEDEDDEEDDEEEEGGDEEKGQLKAPAAPFAEVELLAASPEPASQTPLAPLPPELFRDLPDDERELMARAADMIAGTESVSLSRLQRELGVTYYSAARVFERLEKEGFVAPYTGSLARAVRLSRDDWEARRAGGRPS